MTAHDAQPPGKYRLRTADYLTLSRAGAFDGLRTELIEGDVIVMSPQFRPHGFVKDEIAYRLRRVLESLGSPLHVATEQSVDLPPFNQPEPDIILTGEPRGAGAIPLASIALIAEVAVTTAKLDLGDKARIYASSGVPEYWVADVAEATLHRFWSPEGGSYRQHRAGSFGQPLESATIAGLTIDTAGL